MTPTEIWVFGCFGGPGHYLRTARGTWAGLPREVSAFQLAPWAFRVPVVTGEAA